MVPAELAPPATFGEERSMKWIKIPWRAAWRLVMVDEGLELSGYIAFTAFLSLFPFLIFLAALAGFLGDRETADHFIEAMFASCRPTSPRPWRRRCARWSACASAAS